MELPRRNLLIRCLYAITMLGMLGFLVWESRLPSMTQAAEGVPVTVQETIEKTITLPDQKMPSKVAAPVMTVENIKAFQVFGLSKLIDLNGDAQRQIADHWEALATASMAEKLKVGTYIYAVYHDYDSSSNTFILTLGLKEHHSNLAGVRVVSGNYEVFPALTVPDAWEKTTADFQNYYYQSDFERWRVGVGYLPAVEQAYLGKK